MYFFREYNYHSRMIREFSISCDFTDVTLVGDGVTKAMLNHWKVIVTCIIAEIKVEYCVTRWCLQGFEVPFQEIVPRAEKLSSITESRRQSELKILKILKTGVRLATFWKRNGLFVVCDECFAMNMHTVWTRI